MVCWNGWALTASSHPSRPELLDERAKDLVRRRAWTRKTRSCACARSTGPPWRKPLSWTSAGDRTGCATRPVRLAGHAGHSSAGPSGLHLAYRLLLLDPAGALPGQARHQSGPARTGCPDGNLQHQATRRRGCQRSVDPARHAGPVPARGRQRALSRSSRPIRSIISLATWRASIRRPATFC